ncbi:MAG: hypothetical protein H7318_05035 [Oligoflexus sp.]|nr:hypothetical protein [Oligoflexus sp.]
MNQVDVVQNIIKILKDNFPVLLDVDLTPQTALLSSGLIDSFAMVILLSSLEQEYSISVDTNTLDVMLFETAESMSRIVLDRQFHIT